MFAIDFEVKWSKVKCTGHRSRNSFWALDRYPYHLKSPYHTYKLTEGGQCSLLILGSKSQRSSALDIEVEILFLDSGVLCFPLANTVSHMWTTHGRKMLPIEFWVKRSNVKCTGHLSRNMVSGL
jgi:hypothetical protein